MFSSGEIQWLIASSFFFSFLIVGPFLEHGYDTTCICLKFDLICLTYFVLVAEDSLFFVYI